MSTNSHIPHSKLDSLFQSTLSSERAPSATSGSLGHFAVNISTDPDDIVRAASIQTHNPFEEADIAHLKHLKKRRISKSRFAKKSSTDEEENLDQYEVDEATPEERVINETKYDKTTTAHLRRFVERNAGL